MKHEHFPEGYIPSKIQAMNLPEGKLSDSQVVDSIAVTWNPAAAFVGALEHDICDGQAYNLVGESCIDWGMYNKALMKAIGREVEMVEVPVATLEAYTDDTFQIGPMIYDSFLNNGFFSGEKIARDIPEFHQNIDIEKGMELTYDFYKSNNMIPDCTPGTPRSCPSRPEAYSRSCRWRSQTSPCA